MNTGQASGRMRRALPLALTVALTVALPVALSVASVPGAPGVLTPTRPPVALAQTPGPADGPHRWLGARVRHSG